MGHEPFRKPIPGVNWPQSVGRTLGWQSLGRESLERRALGRKPVGRQSVERRTLGRRTMGRQLRLWRQRLGQFQFQCRIRRLGQRRRQLVGLAMGQRFIRTLGQFLSGRLRQSLGRQSGRISRRHEPLGRVSRSVRRLGPMMENQYAKAARRRSDTALNGTGRPDRETQ